MKTLPPPVKTLSSPSFLPSLYTARLLQKLAINVFLHELHQRLRKVILVDLRARDRVESDGARLAGDLERMGPCGAVAFEHEIRPILKAGA